MVSQIKRDLEPTWHGDYDDDGEHAEPVAVAVVAYFPFGSNGNEARSAMQGKSVRKNSEDRASGRLRFRQAS